MKVKVTATSHWTDSRPYIFEAKLKKGTPNWMKTTVSLSTDVEGFHYRVGKKLAKRRFGGAREIEVRVGDVIEVLCPA